MGVGLEVNGRRVCSKGVTTEIGSREESRGLGIQLQTNLLTFYII